jgi:uncharacterized protein YjbI with pentapeptide repeats
MSNLMTEPENRTMAEGPKTEPKPLKRWEMKIRTGSLPRWARPFAWLGWVMEWTAYSLRNWALITIIGYIFKLSLAVGVIFYLMEAPTRRKQAQYDAWRVITSNEGKAGSGGRIQALQDLNKDGVELAGVDLRKAFLRGINLSKAHLFGADLSGADLGGADLSGADLGGADLSKADLSKADLGGADLGGAHLSGADLSGADLGGAHLSKADLGGANLRRADLGGADLSKAYLGGADLGGADLSEANLFEANLFETDLSEVTGLTQAEVDSAKGSGHTKLPKGLVRPKHWAMSPTK